MDEDGGAEVAVFEYSRANNYFAVLRATSDSALQVFARARRSDFDPDDCAEISNAEEISGDALRNHRASISSSQTNLSEESQASDARSHDLKQSLSLLRAAQEVYFHETSCDALENCSEILLAELAVAAKVVEAP